MFGLFNKADPAEHWPANAREEFRDRLLALVAAGQRAGLRPGTMAEVMETQVRVMAMAHATSAPVDSKFM
jgi:hypothetical protein